MEELTKSFDRQIVARKNGKSYVIIPLTDHCQATRPILLRQAVTAICKIINWKGIDMVVGEEERGGFIAVGVAMKKNLPFSLAKQNPIHIPGEIGVRFGMAYNQKMTLYINGLTRGKKVVLVDDMIDSGGTIIAMIKALKKAGVIIMDVVALAERSEKKGVERINKETGIEVKTIIKLDTSGETSKIF